MVIQNHYTAPCEKVSPKCDKLYRSPDAYKCTFIQIDLITCVHPFFCKNVKHNYLRKNRKEITESILKDCFFYFSDPGCYKLVNKTKVSRDLDSGGPELGYNEMLIKCFIMIFF